MAVSKLPKTRSKIYSSWRNMTLRCDNIQNDNYKYYGAKGITYCSKWKTFKGFCEDMLETHRDGLSLDRIDNNKGYSKENCRWATREEQMNNVSTNRMINIDGEVLSLAQWIRKVSTAKPSTVRQRYYAYKWDIKRALGIGE